MRPRVSRRTPSRLAVVIGEIGAARDRAPRTDGGCSMTAEAVVADQGDAGGQLVCWCCGQHQRPEDVVHLGDHPEVGVCLGCAHFLHQRARAREDEQRPSPASRARDGLRAVRGLVIARRWHEKPVIGPVLRWLGTHLP